MDATGLAFAAVVVVVAAALLFWHVQQVKKRPATTYDKMTGGLWAAILVLAVGRVIFLVTADRETKDAGAPPPAAPK